MNCGTSANGFVHTAKIGTFLFHPRFPVDIRHNAKIGRESSWPHGRHASCGAGAP